MNAVGLRAALASALSMLDLMVDAAPVTVEERRRVIEQGRAALDAPAESTPGQGTVGATLVATCAHVDPLVIDGKTAWCPPCGALYGMGRWRLPEHRPEPPPRAERFAAAQSQVMAGYGDTFRRLAEGPEQPTEQAKSERAFWGVWCAQEGRAPGHWRGSHPVGLGAVGPDLETTRVEAERVAKVLNENAVVRTDSVGWRYEARPYALPRPSQAKDEHTVPRHMLGSALNVIEAFRPVLDVAFRLRDELGATPDGIALRDALQGIPRPSPQASTPPAVHAFACVDQRSPEGHLRSVLWQILGGLGSESVESAAQRVVSERNDARLVALVHETERDAIAEHGEGARGQRASSQASAKCEHPADELIELRTVNGGWRGWCSTCGALLLGANLVTSPSMHRPSQEASTPATTVAPEFAKDLVARLAWTLERIVKDHDGFHYDSCPLYGEGLGDAELSELRDDEACDCGSTDGRNEARERLAEVPEGLRTAPAKKNDGGDAK